MRKFMSNRVDSILSWSLFDVIIRWKLSVWATLIFVIFAVAQMQPGLHQIVEIPLMIAFGLFIWIWSRLEGRLIERRKHYKLYHEVYKEAVKGSI
jgi:hypothetical protein